MDRSPKSRGSSLEFRENEITLQTRIEAFTQRLDAYRGYLHGLVIALDDLLQELPEDKSLKDVLDAPNLDRVDSIILSGCGLDARRKLEHLKNGPWSLRPHQFVAYWGCKNLSSPTFLNELRKLSKTQRNLKDALAALNESRGISSRGTRKNPESIKKSEIWLPKHVSGAIKAFSTSDLARRNYCRASNRPPHVRKNARNTSQPLSSANCLEQTSPRTCEGDEIPQSLAKNELDLPQCVIISDGESDAGEVQSIVEYDETLRSKCVNSLQPGKWLIEDVFEAVLSPFITHSVDTLLINPGLMDVNNPAANSNKRLRDLKPSHKLVLVPLNINRQHWIIAILRPSVREAIIYDPMHLKTNTDRAELALRSFGHNEGQTGPFSDWTYSIHTRDSFNCGIFCCIVALCAILDRVPPETTCPAFWRRGFLQLVGGEPGHMHSEGLFECDDYPGLSQAGLCEHDGHSDLSEKGLNELHALVNDVVGHSYMVAEANEIDMTRIRLDLEFMEDISRRFHRNLRIVHSEIDHLRSVVYQRRGRLEKMRARMSADITEMESCWFQKTGIHAEMH